MCIERRFIPFLTAEVFETMPATSAALKRNRQRARERAREWKKQHPGMVDEQKKRYYTLNKNRNQDMLRQWRENYPEKVRAQKRRHYERKVWSQIPRTRQRKGNKDEYDADDTILGLFGARTRQRKQDEYDPGFYLKFVSN